MKFKTVSNPKLPKKHDTVNHFDPSQMVLELVDIRQSFPNNIILDVIIYTLLKTNNFIARAKFVV